MTPVLENQHEIPPVVAKALLNEHDHGARPPSVLLHTDHFGLRQVFWVDQQTFTLRRRWQTPQGGWCFDHDLQGVEQPIITQVAPDSGIAAYSEDHHLLVYVVDIKGQLTRGSINDTPGACWVIDHP